MKSNGHGVSGDTKSARKKIPGGGLGAFEKSPWKANQS